MFLTKSRLDILAPGLILLQFVLLAADHHDLCILHRRFSWMAHRAAAEGKLVVPGAEVE